MSKKKVSARVRNEAKMGYLFASPWFIGVLVFTLYPILQSIRYSFMDYNILQEPIWIGIENYTSMLNSRLFWLSMYNTLYFVLLSVPLSIVVGLAIALLLNVSVKGMSMYRTIYYMPSIVPVVASSILWIWMFNPNFGLLTNAVEFFGVDSPSWLADPAWAKASLVIMSLWGAGAGMIIYLAGLKNIPSVYYEAADLDGAGVFRKFFTITIPMLSPTIFFQFVMGLIGAFQVFTQAFVMTGGGPNDATLFYVLYIFNNAFRFWAMGYASALAWVLFVIIMFLTWVNFRLANYWVNYDHA